MGLAAQQLYQPGSRVHGQHRQDVCQVLQHVQGCSDDLFMATGQQVQQQLRRQLLLQQHPASSMHIAQLVSHLRHGTTVRPL